MALAEPSGWHSRAAGGGAEETSPERGASLRPYALLHGECRPGRGRPRARGEGPRGRWGWWALWMLWTWTWGIWRRVGRGPESGTWRERPVFCRLLPSSLGAGAPASLVLALPGAPSRAGPPASRGRAEWAAGPGRPHCAALHPHPGRSLARAGATSRGPGPAAPFPGGDAWQDGSLGTSGQTSAPFVVTWEARPSLPSDFWDNKFQQFLF